MMDKEQIRSEIGASAVEYSLIIALIAAVIVLAVAAFGGLTGDLFAGTCAAVHDGIVTTGQSAASCD